MSLPLPAGFRERWFGRQYVGVNKPYMLVRVRKGYLKRRYDAAGDWGADWTPTTAWKALPNVASCGLEQNLDQNGLTVCTLDISNVFAYDRGTHHTFERGWFSPFRSYVGAGRPGPMNPDGSPRVANEWDRLLNTAAQIDVWQGLGQDVAVRTFTGLIDSSTGGSKPDHLRVTSRCFGQLLTDAHLFGWNIDPKMRDRLTFCPESWLKRLESGSPEERRQAQLHRKRWVIVNDYAEIVRWSLRNAGFPKNQWAVQDTGANLAEPLVFDRSQTHIDVIRKVQDLTGYTFFVGEPTASFPLGVPTFRRTKAVVKPLNPVLDLKAAQMLTGCQWATDDNAKSSIIRVRGKETPTIRGGLPLGHDRPTILGVYRPPWHRSNPPRDARILKHVTITEPLYKTQQQVDVTARMIALAQAMAGDTATVEIPAYPGLQLDDIINLDDPYAGINSRAWIAQKTSTFTTGKDASWKMSLGTGLLDTPDVTDVLADLALVLSPNPLSSNGGLLAP